MPHHPSVQLPYVEERALFSCQTYAVANFWGCSKHSIYSFCASSCWRTPDNETEGQQVQHCHRKIIYSMQGWALERTWKLTAITKTSCRQCWRILIWILIILIPQFCKCTDNRSALSCRDKDIILKRNAYSHFKKKCIVHELSGMFTIWNAWSVSVSEH